MDVPKFFVGGPNSCRSRLLFTDQIRGKAWLRPDEFREFVSKGKILENQSSPKSFSFFLNIKWSFHSTEFLLCTALKFNIDAVPKIAIFVRAYTFQTIMFGISSKFRVCKFSLSLRILRKMRPFKTLWRFVSSTKMRRDFCNHDWWRALSMHPTWPKKLVVSSTFWKFQPAKQKLGKMLSWCSIFLNVCFKA